MSPAATVARAIDDELNEACADFFELIEATPGLRSALHAWESSPRGSLASIEARERFEAAIAANPKAQALSVRIVALEAKVFGGAR